MSPTPPLHVQPSSLEITFYKVASGREKESLSKINNLNPSAKLFKALGAFDIVSICDNTSTLPIAEIALSSYQSITGIKWDCDTYKSPNLNSWLNACPIAGIVFLEIDKWIYSEQTILSESIKQIINYFLLPERGWSNENISFFGGLGKSELYAIIKSNDFNEVINFVNESRKITYKDIDASYIGQQSELFSIFTSTHTIPLISYETVIKNKNYNSVAGKIYASMSIKCLPGFEQEILAHKLFRQGHTMSFSSFGTNDLSVLYSEKLNAGDLVKNLLDFRSTWKKYDSQSIETNTTLLFPPNQIPPPDLYDITNIDGYPHLNDRFRKLKPLWSSKIESIARRVKSLLNSRQSYPSVIDIKFLPARILGEVENYIDEIDNGNENSYVTEGLILDLIEIAEISLIQRSGSKFGDDSGTFLIPPEYGDGILAAIQAIEQFIKNIFILFSELYKEYDFEWKGCVFFSSTYGFKYHDGYNFSLPSDAVSSAIGKEYNWLTLTHEISHAISTIVDIEYSAEHPIVEAIKRLSGNSLASLNEYSEIKEELYEIFAHWYDYYHFYNGDLNFYQKCIWESWNAVPRVNKQKQEYVFRSFCIYVFSDLEEYLKNAYSENEKEYLHVKWSKYSAYLKKLLPFIYKDFEVQNHKEELIAQVLGFGHPFSYIATEHRHNKFRDELHKPYKNFNRHLKNLKNGEIIQDEIENPYKLVFESRRAADSLSEANISMITFSLIMCFRNNIKFLK